MRRNNEHIQRFYVMFRANLSRTSTVLNAYKVTEYWHVKNYGTLFYKNYKTFRSAKSQLRKRNVI